VQEILKVVKEVVIDENMTSELSQELIAHVESRTNFNLASSGLLNKDGTFNWQDFTLDEAYRVVEEWPLSSKSLKQ